MSNLEIHGVGSSDHLGLLACKKRREIRSKPKTTRKRIYKNLEKADFIKDFKEAKQNGAFEDMFKTDDIEKAGATFTREFLKILQKRAPLKVIQNRNGYVPYISKELNAEMEERNKLKKEAAATEDI